MTTRNIKKSLAGMEDLVQGIGTVSQTRAGEAVEVTRVDVPLYVEDETAMSALDVSKWTRARIYDTTVSFTDYIYDADSLEGIGSDTGPGTWLETNVKPETEEVLNSPTLAITLDDPKLVVGDAINLKERTAGNGGGAMWDVYPEGTFPVGEDIYDVYDHVSLPLQLKMRVTGVVDIRQFGGKHDSGVTDNTPIVEAIEVAGFKVVLIDISTGSGNYYFSSPPSIPNITTIVSSSTNITGVTLEDLNAITFNNGLTGFAGAPELAGKNIEIVCGTVRQAQLVAIGSNPSNSITSIGTTATVTQISHGYGEGQRVYIRDADQEEYNGTFVISNVTADTYDYTLSATTTSPATGGIAVRNLSQWVYIKDGNHEPIGVVDDAPLVAVGRELEIPFTKEYSRVLSLIVAPDESFSEQLNMTVGASVGLDKIVIKPAITATLAFNLEYTGGGNWGFGYGQNQGATDADFQLQINSVTHDSGTGVTTIEHDCLPGWGVTASSWAGGTTLGGGVPFMPVIKDASQLWLGDNEPYKLELKWVDLSTGTYSLTQNAPMAAIISKTWSGSLYMDGQAGTEAFDLDKGNIWFFGIMEV